MLSRHRSVRSGNAGHRCSASAEQTSLLAPSDLALRGPFFWGRGSGCQSAIDLAAHRRPYTRTRLMKCLTIVCLGALLTLSAAPDAFAWGAVTGPRGGAAYRGPAGGAAVRTPSGAAAVRGPYGAGAVRGPAGNVAVRGPVYGGTTVYRGGYYGGGLRPASRRARSSEPPPSAQQPRARAITIPRLTIAPRATTAHRLLTRHPDKGRLCANP